MRKLFSILLCLSGIAIFIITICEEIDGIGRFACIFTGTVFTLTSNFFASPGNKTLKELVNDKNEEL